MLTVHRAAKILNLTDETIRRYIRKGELKATLDSRKRGYQISADDLRDFRKRKLGRDDDVQIISKPPVKMNSEVVYKELVAEYKKLRESIDKIDKLMEILEL